MAFKSFKNKRDGQSGVEEVAHDVPTPIDCLLRQSLEQIHNPVYTFTKENLINLVPKLSPENNYYNLGMVLSLLQARIPSKEFRDVLLDNEISPRMKSYLVAIYVKFNALKIPCPLDVSWRTLGEGVAIINAVNYQKIIQLCRERSAKEVRKYIREKNRRVE